MASLSTHVLDTATGRPASGVSVSLERDGRVIATRSTDAEGRIRDLATGLAPGRYRLTFEVAGSFFSRLSVDVEVAGDPHYHVPLLMAPFSLGTYRGS